MPGLSWTTPQQRQFIEAELSTFQQHQASKTTHLFWPKLQKKWYSAFPEELSMIPPLPYGPNTRPLTQEEEQKLAQATKKRNGQLMSLLLRESKKKRGVSRSGVRGSTGTSTTLAGGASSRVASTVTRAFIKSIEKKAGRVHHEPEMFAKLFGDRIKAELVERGWLDMNEAAHADQLSEGGEDETFEARNARVKAMQSARMKLQRTVRDELWSKASPEEREKVLAAIALEREEKEKQKLKLEDVESEMKTPEEYQRGVDSLDEVIMQTGETIQQLSGWAGMTIAGGIVPGLGGRIAVKVICWGETAEGNNFRQSHPTFLEAIEVPFNAFLQGVFSEEERKRRALNNTEDNETEDDDEEPETPAVVIPKPRRVRRKAQDLPVLPEAIPPAPAPAPVPAPPPATVPSHPTPLTTLFEAPLDPVALLSTSSQIFPAGLVPDSSLTGAVLDRPNPTPDLAQYSANISPNGYAGPNWWELVGAFEPIPPSFSPPPFVQPSFSPPSFSPRSFSPPSFSPPSFSPPSFMPPSPSPSSFAPPSSSPQSFSPSSFLPPSFPTPNVLNHRNDTLFTAQPALQGLLTPCGSSEAVADTVFSAFKQSAEPSTQAISIPVESVPKLPVVATATVFTESTNIVPALTSPGRPSTEHTREGAANPDVSKGEKPKGRGMRERKQSTRIDYIEQWGVKMSHGSKRQRSETGDKGGHETSQPARKKAKK
ncbi:hypothetical protein MIND_01347300 [Mycena indigotica]|uniref:Uncharacterized protein n=1 Tax=Mycena indigotica TaxID=2126181 RepID=A0A8H6S0N9_9AGAR|nr:uncharacterized protein MIND_01347300 [Mycena indigotica]KAF7289737.1 hypothetical protein MIND_01347300 [Mycena indigotica]